jgi:DNA-directed RNA polymerase subunit omega
MSVQRCTRHRAAYTLHRTVARITIEIVSTSFQIGTNSCSFAAYRARLITHGLPPTVDIDRDKAAIVTLREIVHGTTPADDLPQALTHSLQHNVEVDEPNASAAPSIGQAA